MEMYNTVIRELKHRSNSRNGRNKFTISFPKNIDHHKVLAAADYSFWFKTVYYWEIQELEDPINILIGIYTEGCL